MFDSAKFKDICSKRGLTLEKVAKSIGINPATLYRKMIGDSDFTRGDIQNLSRLLRLSKKDINDIFFAEELA